MIYHIASERIAKIRMSQRPDPGKTSLPTNDSKEYDRLLGIWDSPEEDLKQDQNGHVSMIKYDTENNQLYPVRINESIKPLADRVIHILSTNSPSKS